MVEQYSDADRLNMQLSSNLKIAQGGWAVQREGIASQLKIAKMQLAFQREQMVRIGIPTMQADIWYKQRQIDLAEKAHSLAQSNLGFEYLKFASTLQGPENYFQSADFARGATSRQDVPVFMQSLLSNLKEGNASFGSSGMAPDPLTANSLISKLQGSTPDSKTGKQDSAALAAMGQVFQGGAGRLAPGTLESLDKSELAMLASGGGKLGFDVPRWLRDYQSTRVSSENPNLA